MIVWTPNTLRIGSMLCSLYIFISFYFLLWYCVTNYNRFKQKLVFALSLFSSLFFRFVSFIAWIAVALTVFFQPNYMCLYIFEASTLSKKNSQNSQNRQFIIHVTLLNCVCVLVDLSLFEWNRKNSVQLFIIHDYVIVRFCVLCILFFLLINS